MVKLLNLLLILSLIFPMPVWSQALTDVQRQELNFKNHIKNNAFENSTTGWSVSGGDTFTVTSGSPARQVGRYYVDWNSAGAGRIFTHPAITVDYEASGKNGLCSYRTAVASGTATHLIRVLVNGTDVVASKTITSNTVATDQELNFTFGAVASTYQCQLISVAANEPSIAIFNAYGGLAYNIANGTIVTGRVPYAVAPTLVGFGTPSNLESYWWRVGDVLWVQASWTNGTVTGTEARFPFPPGLTAAASTQIHNAGSFQNGNGSSDNRMNLMVRGGETFFIFARGGDLATIANGNSFNTSERMKILGSVPIAEWAGSGTTVTTDQLPASWSGYHTAGCDGGWTRTSTSFGDFSDDATSCSLVEKTNSNFGSVVTYGAAKPGIVFTPKRAGRYLVLASFTAKNGTASGISGFRFSDGTTTFGDQQFSTVDASEEKPVPLQGIYHATSTAAVSLRIEGLANGVSTNTITCQSGTPASCLNWSIVSLDQSYPMPVLADTRFGFSSSTGTYTNATTSYTDVTNASVSLTVSGTRPVFIGLIPDGTTTTETKLTRASGSSDGSIKVLRDATVVGESIVGTGAVPYRWPVGANFMIDYPTTAGTYTYKMQAKVINGSASETIHVINCKLFVREM